MQINRKLLFFNLMISCFSFNIFAQGQGDYHKSDQNLKGEVHKMVESGYNGDLVDGVVIKKRLLYQDFYSYNHDGFILELRHTNSEILLWRDINVFDGNNNRIEEYRYDGDGNLIFKNTYTFNSLGNQIEKIAYNNNEKVEFKIKNTYNDNGDLMTINRVGSLGQTKVIKKNLYNDEGLLTEEIMYNLTGKPMKIINKYDINGNKIQLELFNSKKKLEEKQMFKYDDNGNLVEHTIFDTPEYLSRKILYSYDNKGNISEKSQYQSKGELLEKDTYEFIYDNLDNLIEEKHYKYYIGTKESTESIKYSNFDENNNWEEKLIYKNGLLNSIVDRKIEYYSQ
ncbi:RHS repeat domain-containing protein [Aestuariivivens sediminis]|uniref:RHS repeat domain-containing protein n=1 Tax=Aestuariivivens sediminis TaxID=2913557 RepID=UPI001F59FB2C|nr:hypothetical protein [Aestuariivivens sediminis]